MIIETERMILREYTLQDFNGGIIKWKVSTARQPIAALS